jgi:hypothetical protein
MPHHAEHHEEAHKGDGSNDNYRQPQSPWSGPGHETIEQGGHSSSCIVVRFSLSAQAPETGPDTSAGLFPTCSLQHPAR